MTRHTIRSMYRALMAALIVLALAGASRAQEVGSVAELQGRAEARRVGESTAAQLEPGATIRLGDRLVTFDDSRLKLLLGEDSVVVLGPNAELTIDQHVVTPSAATSGLSLLRGAMRALATKRYGAKGSSFEVTTPTAVAGIRGTTFLCGVESNGELTRVIGVVDATRVRAAIDPQGRRAVTVNPGEMTEVARGGYPSLPRKADAAALEELTRSTEIGLTETEPPPAGGGPGRGIVPPDQGVIDQPLEQLRKREREGIPNVPPR